MKKILFILSVVLVFTSCRKVERGEFWDVLNCYMVVNKTSDTVNIRLNCPRLTNKDLQPQDTFKYLVEWTVRQQGDFYKSPFNVADTCVLTINNKEYCYNKQDSVKGNPLIFDNYRVEKKSDLYFNMIFEITDEKYY
ncbi:MAG: hypothetical protein II956_01560 [Bacteroidales bacterium]|nr:hypothetical protein [Bacteroidales bacterium]